MADDLTGRVWTLGSGTLDVVSTQQVLIDKIRITWSGASAGYVQLDTVREDDGTADTLILHARTLALASGNVGLLTQEFDFGGMPFKGITKTAMTGVSGETGVQVQLK